MTKHFEILDFVRSGGCQFELVFFDKFSQIKSNENIWIFTWTLSRVIPRHTLFLLLVEEGLKKNKITFNRYQSLKMGNSDLLVSHMQYVNDTLIQLMIITKGCPIGNLWSCLFLIGLLHHELIGLSVVGWFWLIICWV